MYSRRNSLLCSRMYSSNGLFPCPDGACRPEKFIRAPGGLLKAFIGCTYAEGPASVLLGTAANFAILAKTGVSTVPNSAITGNVGVSPATVTSLTGFSLTQDVSKQFWTSTQVSGHLEGSTDALPTPGLLTIAILDMQTAYTDASNRPLPDFVGLKAGLIGTSVLGPGLYKWTTDVTIATGITLLGGPADTWIFQIAGTLVQATNVRITLIGGAQSKNIVWAVAGTVTVGAGGVFQGNILAETDVIIGTNAIDNGCIYAQTAVALQEATVLCAGGVVVPPPSSSPVGSSTVSIPASSTPPATVSSTPTSSTATATYSPQCTPTAPPCFTTAFENLNASIHADDYLSYILTDTVQECIDFCACRPAGCGFANPYYDNNAKNTTMLTCAYYVGCHSAADATNTGGQSEPNGGLSAITNSSGYCLTPCSV